MQPYFCCSIWQHLVDLTERQHKTIVITTHYIEEARQAHMVFIYFFDSLLHFILFMYRYFLLKAGTALCYNLTLVLAVLPRMKGRDLTKCV